MKHQDFLLTVNGQNTSDVLSLTSRYGQPAVRFSVSSNGCANEFVVTSRDDLMRIAEFLQQRCEAEETEAVNSTDFGPTGTGLCIMDHSGNILTTYYGKSGRGVEENSDDWDYEMLQQRFQYPNAIYVIFELFDGFISRNVVLMTLQECVKQQARYVATGQPIFCKKMVLQDIAYNIHKDITVISRATQNVRILTPHKTFTLDNTITSLEQPSLFDSGSKYKGIEVSRLEVVELIKKMIDKENPAKPLGDLAITKALQDMDYQVERRTVAKYRDEFLGIPNSNKRRQRG